MPHRFSQALTDSIFDEKSDLRKEKRFERRGRKARKGKVMLILV